MAAKFVTVVFFPAQRGLENRARNSYGNLGRLGVTELNLCSSSHLDVGLRYSEDSLNDLLVRYCQLTRIATICINFQNPIYQKEKKIPKILTWWQFALEHVHRDHVDDEHPDRAVQHVVLRLDERDRRQALRLEPAAVRVGPAQLAVHVGLELLHVE